MKVFRLFLLLLAVVAQLLVLKTLFNIVEDQYKKKKIELRSMRCIVFRWLHKKPKPDVCVV